MAEHYPDYNDDERVALMEKSADHLQRACELAPFDVLSHRDYSISLLRLGRFEEAEKYQKLALELGWNREYHYNNSFVLARVQYMRALAAMNEIDHVEASAALRRASHTLELGMPRMHGGFRDKGKRLKKRIDEEIAFLKRTESWVEESNEQ